MPSTESRSERVKEIRRNLTSANDPYAILAEALEACERYKREIELLKNQQM